MIRCSSLGKIMVEPKSKSDVLSVGAKTYLNQIAKESVYNYRSSIDSRYLSKGIICEDESIALYNKVNFCELVKNDERKENEFITGECDLFIPNRRGVDIKTAWCLDTFPVLPEECHNKDYEWQARGYMMLWDLPLWDIAYCLVSTPDELIPDGKEDLHYVDHIPPEMRITSIRYERCSLLEKKIKEKTTAALEYIEDAVKRIKACH